MPRTRATRLIARGVRIKAYSAYNGRGPWWNAGAYHMNVAIPVKWLTEQGLFSLLEEHDASVVLREPPYAERHVRWCERLGPQGLHLLDKNKARSGE